MSSTTSTTLPIAKAITAGLRDAMTADERVFLMGEDVESRRRFIQENAKDVRFLDI